MYFQYLNSLYFVTDIAKKITNKKFIGTETMIFYEILIM